jgi:pimeloyl-ACP methyl ester carboxylesterase
LRWYGSPNEFRTALIDAQLAKDVRPDLRRAYEDFRVKAMGALPGDPGRKETATIEIGSGGPTVIYFHGAGDRPDGILAWRWAEAFRREGKPVKILSLEYSLAQVKEALAGTPGKAILLGHSHGGRVAAAVAKQFPDRVAAIVEADAEMDGKRPSVETLFIHGTDDPTIPYKVARRVQRAHADRITLATLKGGDHSLRYRPGADDNGLDKADANASPASARLLDEAVSHFWAFVEPRLQAK